MKPTRLTVLYDAECPLCRRAAAWLQSRDPKGVLEFLPAQRSDEVSACPLDPEAVLEQIHVVSPEGELRTGADGVVWALSQLPRYGWLRAVYAIPGVRSIAQAVYRRVAENRLRFR
ncbi:DUF393 domain-containing protein [Alicyclobacillus sp.]|uniref:thiol-disulfide oxidoreductase DCC family protein n=1 Tax=Alicyclobacillus sp. TaxID=61169 RepID=UPI0025BC13CB|nr:DUF393 domain-containing protein [Alicyclobacillus sp.]MCL6516538.1 DUF393 domain-containing protein [Alicyclobacillus sp.]